MTKIIVKKVYEPKLETTNLYVTPLMESIFGLPGYRYYGGSFADAWKVVREKDSKQLEPFREMVGKTSGYLVRNDGTIFRSPPMASPLGLGLGLDGGAGSAASDPYTLSVLDYLLENNKYFSREDQSIRGYDSYNSLVRLVHDVLTEEDRWSVKDAFGNATSEARKRVRHERFEPHRSSIGGVNRRLSGYYSEPWEMEEIAVVL
jgi:hypothetical protein